MSLLPTEAYLTRGVGRHAHELVAFELALRDAGVAAQNLVTVSSILPPACPLLERVEGEQRLRAGQILHVVMSRVETCAAGESKVAAIGVARPTDPTLHGFIAEHDAHGPSRGEAEAHAIELAGTMLASSLGELPEDPSARPQWQQIGGIAETRCISAEARCGTEGEWVVAVAICVLLLQK